MNRSGILLVAGILLIMRGLTFINVIFKMDDLRTSLCCPSSTTPETWELYLAYMLPIMRGLSSTERALWPYMMWLFLIGAVLALIAGVMGVVSWRNPKRANRCLLWGGAAAIVYPILLWWEATRVIIHPHAFELVRIEIRFGFLLVYALYILGAYQLKKAWRSMEAAEQEDIPCNNP